MGIFKCFYAPEADNGANPWADGSQNATDDLKTTQGEPSKESKTPAWMAQLPNDLKENESLSQYKTLGEAIKGLMEVGKSPEPKEAETVEYGEFKAKIAEDDDPFGDLQNSYVELFKSRNIKQEDAEILIGKINDINAKAKASMLDKAKDYCETNLKERWGKDYETNRKTASIGYKALNDLDGNLQKELDRTGASINPAVWEILARVGKLVAEDGNTVNKIGGIPMFNGVPVDYSKPSK